LNFLIEISILYQILVFEQNFNQNFDFVNGKNASSLTKWYLRFSKKKIFDQIIIFGNFG